MVSKVSHCKLANGLKTSDVVDWCMILIAFKAQSFEENVTKPHPRLWPFPSLKIEHSSIRPKRQNMPRSSISLIFFDSIPTNILRSVNQKYPCCNPSFFVFLSHNISFVLTCTIFIICKEINGRRLVGLFIQKETHCNKCFR